MGSKLIKWQIYDVMRRQNPRGKVKQLYLYTVFPSGTFSFKYKVEN